MTEAGTRAAPRRWRRVVSNGLLVVSVAFIAIFFTNNRDSLELLYAIRPLHVAGLIGIQLVLLALNAARYHIVLSKCAGTAIPWAPWIRLFVVGRFLNIVVPQGGTVYRSVNLKRIAGVSYTQYAAAFVSLVWMATVLNLAISAVVIALFQPGFLLYGLPGAGLVAIAAAGLAAGPPIARRLLDSTDALWPWFRWLRGRLQELLGITLVNLSDLRFMAITTLLTLVDLALATTCLALCFVALGQPAVIGQILLFYVALQLGNFVTVTPGNNLGVQEIVLGLLAEGTSLGLGGGMLVSGLLRAAVYAVILLSTAAYGGFGTLRALNTDAEEVS